MPRGKLGMQLIENPKKRRAAYKNRRDGLVQKTSQLATLCGVEALLVCFDPKPAGGAGHDGGRVVFEGTPAQLVADGSTLTAQHLAAYVGR